MSDFEGRVKLGARVMTAIDEARDDITAIARQIHRNPESAGEEYRAAELLTGFLDRHGFTVEQNVAGLTTAFHAGTHRWDEEQMRKGLRHGHVAFLASYDAVPGQGHVYGHHLAAGAAIAAGLGLASTLDSVFGTISVFGCPGPLAHGGKAHMKEAGLFDPVDAALGAQPAPTGLGFQPTISSTGETLAELRLTVDYPDESGEALEALQQAVSAVIDELQEHEQIYAVEAGFVIRAPRASRAEDVAARIRALAEARASSSGTPVEVKTASLCYDMNVNRALARRIKSFADAIGYWQDKRKKTPPSWVTDWGDVSYVTPACEAYFPITTEEVGYGDARFAELSNTDQAYDQMIEAAKTIALTGLDLLGDMTYRGFAEGDFIRGLKERGVKREPRRWLGVHPVEPPKNPKPRGTFLDRGGIIRGPGLPPDPDLPGR